MFASLPLKHCGIASVRKYLKNLLGGMHSVGRRTNLVPVSNGIQSKPPTRTEGQERTAKRRDNPSKPIRPMYQTPARKGAGSSV